MSDVIIKRSDKGGEMVVWSNEDYIEEGTRQLSSDGYEPTSELSLLQASENVRNLLAEY
ncbi:hypothetical protein GJ496_008461, partial [Pomphorhynchus laevis]